MRAARLALAAVLLTLALVCALAAHDVLVWSSTLDHGDRALRVHPRDAQWASRAWLPGDPVRSLLGLGDDVQLREAVRAFEVAAATGRGFDAGETQTRSRSAAEVRLSDVAAGTDQAVASQAGNLLGVLVASGGQVAGGITAEDRAQDAFDAAVRRDPSNLDAKYNLELLLRRTRATATRHGPGSGAGSRGRGRGAGSGTPGRGY